MRFINEAFSSSYPNWLIKELTKGEYSNKIRDYLKNLGVDLANDQVEEVNDIESVKRLSLNPGQVYVLLVDYLDYSGYWDPDRSSVVVVDSNKNFISDTRDYGRLSWKKLRDHIQDALIINYDPNKLSSLRKSRKDSREGSDWDRDSHKQYFYDNNYAYIYPSADGWNEEEFLKYAEDYKIDSYNRYGSKYSYKKPLPPTWETDHPRNSSKHYDKSGYLVDPQRLVKKLARMNAADPLKKVQDYYDLIKGYGEYLDSIKPSSSDRLVKGLSKGGYDLNNKFDLFNRLVRSYDDLVQDYNRIIGGIASSVELRDKDSSEDAVRYYNGEISNNLSSIYNDIKDFEKDLNNYEANLNK